MAPSLCSSNQPTSSSTGPRKITYSKPFPCLLSVLSEGLAPHSQQQRHFGMIRSADTLEFGLWLTGSGGSPQRGFGSCCCPIQTAWQLGAFPQQNCPRGTCSSPTAPPHPPRAASSHVPPQTGHLSWGHPVPGRVCHGSEAFGWVGGLQSLTQT